jgi:hypothetical protein
MGGGDRTGPDDGADRGGLRGIDPVCPASHRPGPSVPAGVLVIHDAGWHPAFGAQALAEPPRMRPSADRYLDHWRDRLSGLRLDVDRRWDDLDTTELDGSSQAHRPRPSRPRLASGASGAPTIPGPARSAGADVVSAIQRAQRRRGATQAGWLEGSGLEAGESLLSEARAVSGDVGGLAVAVVGVSMGVRPVRIDEQGRICELSGERFVMPGLEPADVLAGLADAQAGRIRSLKAIREGRAGGRGGDERSARTVPIP